MMQRKQIATLIAGCLISTASLGANTLNDFSYNNVSDKKTIIQLGMSNDISVTEDASIVKNNKGIKLRLRDIENNVGSEEFEIDNWGQMNTQNSNGDTVLNFSLDQDAKYNLVSDDNRLMLVLERTEQLLSDDAVETIDKASPDDALITDIDFERESKGASQVKIEFKNDVRYETIEKDDRFRVVIYGAKLPSSLFRSVEVSDFDTPLKKLVSRVEDGNIIIDAHYKEDRDVDNVFTKVGEKLVLLTSNKELVQDKKNYEGHYIDLDFQQIPLKNTIQNLADKMDMNVLISEQVSGELTLKLDDVPYDEALNAILEAKNLGKEKKGNITFIAPKDEIHQKKKRSLEDENKIDELTPLSSFSWDVKYAEASEIASLVSQYTSERGEVFHDDRTNRLMVEDIPKNIKRIQEAVIDLDVPLRQVVVESRIVLAKRSEGESYGVGIGGEKVNVGSSDRITLSGGADNNMLTPLALGNPTSSLAVGFLTDTVDLDAILSAMERDGSAEIVSRPKILTSNKKSAQIETGQEIPYDELSDNGVSGTSFKDVKLSLDVTPTITPDEKVKMELDINQDSLGQQTENGVAIDTSSIQTEVLANNGETIVLGGIYKTDTTESESGVPLLKDIPYLGNLFKRTSTQEEEFELIIFITPKLFENETVN